MIYICRVYADGNPEDCVNFDTYQDAIKWAKRHARIVPPLSHGWDIRYTVRIYLTSSPDVDTRFMEPVETISPE
jgi:hypothetical protein